MLASQYHTDVNEIENCDDQQNTKVDKKFKCHGFRGHRKSVLGAIGYANLTQMVAVNTNERCKSRQSITQCTNETSQWASQEVSVSSKLRGRKGCGNTSGRIKYLQSVQNLANLIRNANKLAAQSRKVFRKGVQVFDEQIPASHK